MRARFGALVALALLTGCGETVRVFRGKAPAAPSASAAKGQDPEAWRAQRPGPGTPGELRFPTPELVTLPNGLKLYVIERPAPVVTASLVVRHGAASVPAGKSGLAGLTARMLTEGTKKHGSLELAEAIENLGSSLNSDASRDESSVGLSALGSDLDQALSLLAEVVQAPAFAPKDFERVKSEWLDSLVSERQNPQRLASMVGLRLLNGSVHGAPVRGGVTDVKALSIRDLQAFHRQAYTPKNAALIVVGQVDRAALRASVERHFGGWRGVEPSAPLPFKPAEPASKLRVVVVDRPGAVQSALFAVQAFPKRSDGGHEVREVLGKVVGGLFTSRINLNLREKHAYTYGAFGQPLSTHSWGAFFVSTSVRTDATAAALAEIVSELEAARDPARGVPIKADEVARAKADLIHSVGATLEHTSRVAGTISEIYVDDLPADYYARYPATLAAIDEKAVAKAATSLEPRRMIAVIVGDRAQIEKDLASRGWTVEAAAPELVD
jgi:zinc protease